MKSLRIEKVHGQDHKPSVTDAIQTAHQHHSIELFRIDFHDVEAILKACGSETKNFHWEPIDVMQVVNGNTLKRLPMTSSDVMKILQLLPNLEYLYLVHFNVGKIGGKIKLNLPKLKSLHIDSTNSSKVYEIFNKILSKNSIIEHSLNVRFCKDLSEFDVKVFRDFLKNQKSIKNFSTDYEEIFQFIKILELDELKLFLKNSNPQKIVEILKKQPNLKFFDFRNYDSKFDMNQIVEELSKLPKLETLKVCFKLENCESLKTLKNIKELDLINFQNENFLKTFLDEPILNLKKFTTVCDISNAEMIQNLPNLKYLDAHHVSLNFNSFAKFLTNIEDLNLLIFNENFKFCELDTGIVNENLKKVVILVIHGVLIDNIEEVLEVFEICPNLENFSFVASKSSSAREIRSKDLVEKKFFEKLNEVENLKVLKLSYIQLHNFQEYFDQIRENLKKLSRKLDFIEIRFQDKFGEDPGLLSYGNFIENLQETFEIVEHQENEFECLLTIKSEKNFE